MNIKQTIRQNILNIPGWRTNRHIVVIESDDWGSIRMPSKEVYDKLKAYGIKVEKSYYCSNDSIATVDDLSLLFETLNSVRDENYHAAIITANAVVANPDFEKIKADNFTTYHYKLITESIPSITGCERSLTMWKEGNRDGFFVLQSHGREHLNVARWMRYLEQGCKETRFAFELGVYGVAVQMYSQIRKSYLPAFDFETKKEEFSANEIAKDGLRIFEDLFGFSSKSFIAPNYTWGKSLEKTLLESGVYYLQGQQRAIYKNSGSEHNRKRIRKMGGKSELGLIDLCRNCMFEPSSAPDRDWVASCLHDIENAFLWRHPAIVCSHRVNFISAINPQNRDNGLKQLSRLLKEVVKRWPDVEFMSSDQLGDLIVQKNGKY